MNIPQNFEFNEPVKVNPLSQHFRRAKIYVDLPYGKYNEGVVIQTFQLPVFPMTQIDEITAKTPDALMNGSATVQIIKSCIPSIINPWKLSSIDLDACLLAIKVASNGGNMETYQKCPKCGELNSFDINLSQILQQITAAPFLTKKLTLESENLEIEFQPLDYQSVELAEKQQFDMTVRMKKIQENPDQFDQDTQLQQMRDLTKLTHSILLEFVARSIKSIKNTSSNTLLDISLENVVEWLQNIDKNMFTSIQNFVYGLKQETEMKPLEFTCSSEQCKHTWTSPLMLNYSDFFA